MTSAPQAQHESRALPGELWVFIGAVLWSSGGVAVKWLDLSPLAISSARSLLAALFFAAVSRDWWKGGSAGGGTVAKGAIAYCAVVTLYVIATKWTTAANAIIFQYTAPLWIAALSWPLLRERPPRRDLVCLLLGFVGVAVCLSDKFTLSLGGGVTLATLGDMVGLASGVAFALLVLILRETTHLPLAEARRMNWRILIVGNLLTFAVGAPALWSELGAGAIGGAALAVLLWLGIAQLGSGYLAFQHGLRTTPALRASIISLAEPVLNPLWVMLVVEEVPSANTLAGGLIVLAVLAGNALVGRRRRAVPPGVT